MRIPPLSNRMLLYEVSTSINREGVFTRYKREDVLIRGPSFIKGSCDQARRTSCDQEKTMLSPSFIKGPLIREEGQPL